MARGGVNKAVVQTARLALIARGDHPSIDAVRIEMGNTGSKTTIHRYLKELDDAEGLRQGPAVTLNDELTELVNRLAQRLEAQGAERVDRAESDFDARRRALEEELNTLAKTQAETREHLTQRTQALIEQTAALALTRTQLVSQQIDNVRLIQNNQDMTARLADKDAHLRSLEEKHLHARDALEHYRNSIKEQRDQEQRRHEAQVQQLQMELRQAQQRATVRQEEITQLNRDNERLLAENRGVVRDLNTHRDQLATLTGQLNSSQEQVAKSATRATLLEERLRTTHDDSAAFKQRLTDQKQQNRVLELILIKTELALEQLRLTQLPASAEQDPSSPAQD